MHMYLIINNTVCFSVFGVKTEKIRMIKIDFLNMLQKKI